MSFSASYHGLVTSGAIEPDPAQEEAVRSLAMLDEEIISYRLARKSSSLGWLFSKSARKQPPPRGRYIHGEVGRGKTMLMDLFFQSSPVERKRRAHFHEFMADVHERVHAIRQRIARGDNGTSDPVRIAADSIFDESWLICFDEFHVTDIADAMILGRLFSRLFELGVVVVATSNVRPDDLYKNGLNRALFLPFIGELQTRMDVLRLDARTDFRLEKLAGLKVWHVPADANAHAALNETFARITGGAPAQPVRLLVKGREFVVPRAAAGVAWLSFEELCERPLGASDYLSLAHAFHTLIIESIPALDGVRRNEAKRFITLIDALYDNGFKLVASAQTPPQHIYAATEGVEAMEFQRTVSRLIEMSSEDYLARPHGRGDSTASGVSDGLVET